MTQRVGIGQVGLGALGQVHAENLVRSIGAAEVVRVVDLDEGAAETFGRRHGIEWSTSLDSLTDDPEITGVVVATPTSTHPGIVCRLARAKKHVFVEKPIALDHGSTLETTRVIKESGVLFQVGFHRRFDRDWCELKRRTDAGELGQPYLCRLTQRDMATPPEMDLLNHGGSFLVDAHIHDFDAVRWLIGEVSEVTTYAASLSSPVFGRAGDMDNCIVVLRFANGALGVIDGSRVAGYGYESSVEVLGSRATGRITHGARHDLQWLTRGSVRNDLTVDHIERHRDAYVAELAHFVECIRTSRKPTVGAAEGLAAFILASAAEASLRTRTTVTLTRAQARTGVDHQRPPPS